MQLTLLMDCRFSRDAHGVVFSCHGYNYPFFASRYLTEFDRLRIVARLDPVPIARPPECATEGERVEFVSVGNWKGPLEFLWRRRGAARAMKQHLLGAEAVIAVVPGILGGLSCPVLRLEGHPYGVEVMADPRGIFARRCIRHPLRPWFRVHFTRELRMQCAGACAAAYVTEHALQRSFPPAAGAFQIACSDVNLPEAAFLGVPPREAPRGATKTLIFVGSLAQMYKGPDVLLQAVARSVRGGLDLRLVMVGDGKHRPAMEALAARLGIAERVFFQGQLPSGEAVRAAFDRADLFVLPSRTEGLPRATVEAMARGLPCIGSTVGGFPELLAAEDLVPPNDEAALARKIHEVLFNPERMVRMSARNRQRAEDFRDEVLAQRRGWFYRFVHEETERWQCRRRAA